MNIELSENYVLCCNYVWGGGGGQLLTVVAPLENYVLCFNYVCYVYSLYILIHTNVHIMYIPEIYLHILYVTNLFQI